LPRNGNKTAACISVRSFQLSTRLQTVLVVPRDLFAITNCCTSILSF
jgi:hypothetical protein